MKRRNDQTMSQALERMVDAFGMREKMDEQSVISCWDSVAGGMVARHTTRMVLRKGKLTIGLDSAPLRQELSYMRNDLLAALNERLGREVVTEIVLQ